MNSELRDKLRRLGVHKGAAHLNNAGRLKAPPAAQAISQSPHPYERISTPFGEAVVRRARFGLSEHHGDRLLREGAARLGAITPTEFDLTRAVFIDTETTGLAGGARWHFWWARVILKAMSLWWRNTFWQTPPTRMPCLPTWTGW
jgi:hypothetical protein